MKTQFLGETKWQPRNNQLLLVPTLEEEKSEGGIIIPETVRRKACSGFIAKKGPDVDPSLRVGDEVFFEQHQEYRIVLDDINEDAVLIADNNILLSRRPDKVVTSQPAAVNVAAYFSIETARLAGETFTDYNSRMDRQAPAGYYWNALCKSFERMPDDPDQSHLPLTENK